MWSNRFSIVSSRLIQFIFFTGLLFYPPAQPAGAGTNSTLVVPSVTGLTISQGTSYDSVSLAWSSNVSGTICTISRSAYANGAYQVIGESGETRFTDATAEPGVKYWYRVAVSTGITGTPVSGYGYRKPPNPPGLSLDRLLDGHNKPWPVPATEQEKETESRDLELYEKYYESYFMMTFIIMVGRIYVNSGELLAYRDFKFKSFDQPNRIVYFKRPDMGRVKFFSRRFFRFFRDVQLKELNFYAILKRLIDNGVMFCLRTGEQETWGPDGRTRFIPAFEVVGLMTEYHRDYKNWKGNVIVFGTSDENIYQRIKEAQLKGY
jgi:hypothetical protein